MLEMHLYNLHCEKELGLVFVKRIVYTLVRK